MKKVTKPQKIEESSTKDYKDQLSPDTMKNLLLGTDYQRINLSDYKERNYYSNILASLMILKNDRDSYYKSLEQLKSFYLIQLVIDVLTDSCLSQDKVSGAIIDVSVVGTNKDDVYTKELREFCEKNNISALVEDISEELFLFGEYSVETKSEKGLGVTAIYDSVATGSVVALYESTFPKVFYRLEGQHYKVYPVHAFAHFCIDSRKIKVQVPKELRDRENIEIKSPVFRIGRSVFYGALEKIRELYMLEKAVTANTFFSLTSGNIVSIGVPPTLPLSDVVDITKKYESMLNSAQVSAIDITDINQVVGAIQESFNVKVIPNFSDKGNLEKVDVVSNNQNKETLLPNIVDARNSIAQTIGIPPDLIFGDGSQSRRAGLKQFARYDRKVKSIQRAFQVGLKQIFLNHLAHKYGDETISADSVVVDMHTATNIDELDNLESVQLAIQGLTDMTNVLAAIQGAPVLGLDTAQFIDPVKFLEYVKSTLSAVGFRSSDIITIPDSLKNPKKTALKPNDGSDGDDSDDSDDSDDDTDDSGEESINGDS